MKEEFPKELKLHSTYPEEIQIKYLMKISGISRKEIEQLLDLYGVPVRAIIEYIHFESQNKFTRA